MMIRRLGGAGGQAGLRKKIEQSKVKISKWSRGAERGGRIHRERQKANERDKVLDEESGDGENTFVG